MSDPDTQKALYEIARYENNRAPVRLLLSCLLAKIHKPNIDIRKPYVEIGSDDAYSGRAYDEQYISTFISEYKLPCNPTTAFLTPALRTLNRPLTLEVQLQGKPKELYQKALWVLDRVQSGRLPAKEVLTELIRQLILFRSEIKNEIKNILNEIERQTKDFIPAERIVSIIQKHLKCPRSSRLPVLVLTAAYNTISTIVGKTPKPLHAHTAADKPSGTLGDVEILRGESIVVVYEMKTRKVKRTDIDIAVSKIKEANMLGRIEQYIFITTKEIESEVADRVAQLYQQTRTEFMILDCISFLRHFLHLFHEYRMAFLDEYQRLVLSEPDSAVSHQLKQAFLRLRAEASASPNETS